MRRQEEGESVDSFITSLYRLAEHCNYRDLHNEMIRDRIVVGLRDAALSERLQTDSELTLDKAITMARQTEAVKEQQPVVRGEVENSHARVEAVHGVQSLQQKQTLKNNPTKNKQNRLLVSNLLKLIRRDAPDVANFLHIHAISAQHVKLIATNVESKATISQCVDQPRLSQQYEQVLSQKNLS